MIDKFFKSLLPQGKRSLNLLPLYFLLTFFVVTTVLPTLATSPPSIPEIIVQSRTPIQVLRQGKERYQAGQLTEAASLWQQAAQGFQSQGEILNQAHTLNYLSAVYQDLGQWEQAEISLQNSLALLQKFETLEQRGIAIFAQALNTQGSLQLSQGNTLEALESWKQAERLYQQAGNLTGQLGSRLNQAQALQNLGHYRQAKRQLERLVTTLAGQPDSLLKADGLRSLGVALQTIGDLEQSKQILEESWEISITLNNRSANSATLLSIGNVARDLGQYSVAWDYYQASEQEAITDLAKVQGQLNRLGLLVETQQWDEAIAFLPLIMPRIMALSPSRSSIYAKVNLAENLIQIASVEQPTLSSRLKQNNRDFESIQVLPLLTNAIQQARQLQDARAQAYSLTELGKVYELNQQWKDAEQLTEQSLQLAQRINATDIIARAAWQLGRIERHYGNREKSLTAYQTAFETLQLLRSDLVAINPDVQFDFKESVEPVYRELVSVLLDPSQEKVSQENLTQARQVIEALQLAELDNFFRDACLDTTPILLDQIDDQSMVIYPIILPDRLEVIASFPDQPLRNYSTPLVQSDIEKTLEQLYSSLYLGYSGEERLRLSEEVYNWLLRPVEQDLAASGIETLVFVLDGALRDLPMAALYDGNQYLVENYSTALSPGLQLFPQGLERQALTTLAVGLTEARQGFSALPGVGVELENIGETVNSKVLLNQAFTKLAFQGEMNEEPFRVVHLATHGQFSSNPEDTFLLTWDSQINIEDFDQLFQTRRQGIMSPVELLILSACQTAQGDQRATLGLAGLALRSGARSTVASLWSVNDVSTADLISAFYQQLIQSEQKITKAEALRQAQLTLLHDPRYNHPYFWASFILVGNWL